MRWIRMVLPTASIPSRASWVMRLHRFPGYGGSPVKSTIAKELASLSPEICCLAINRCLIDIKAFNPPAMSTEKCNNLGSNEKQQRIEGEKRFLLLLGKRVSPRPGRVIAQMPIKAKLSFLLRGEVKRLDFGGSADLEIHLSEVGRLIREVKDLHLPVSPERQEPPTRVIHVFILRDSKLEKEKEQPPRHLQP
ncbi:hypothetical protein PIB30_060570 [Stylosanthes scabra]|uniref:Translation initiation factor IF-3 n=1 Tax=Stylosanthes scabra TaxID=79078 RepID=A0ABU6WKG5_9FABA|nr:hypothetical protein [Stylosanthes scabra]